MALAACCEKNRLKTEHFVIIYSPSCRSNPVVSFYTFIFYAQNYNIF